MSNETNTEGVFSTLFQKYKRLIFFDTETTGFDPKDTDQMIELAAVSLDADGTTQEMDDFIHLFRMDELPKKIIELTGIMELDLASRGIDEFDALKKFVDLMQCGGNTLLVAHNAQFDLQFLAYAIYRNREQGKGWMMVLNDCDYLDTLTVYKDRRRFPHRLETAITEYHLLGKVQNSHRAIDDCKALFEVAKCMDEEKQDLDKYVNLFGFNPKYGPEKNQLRKVTYAQQSMDAYMGKPLYESIKR